MTATTAAGAVSPARAIGFWEGVRLVAKRDILMQLRSKAFLISVAIVLLFVAGGIVAMGLFGQQAANAEPPSVAATSETAPLAEGAGLQVTVVDSPEAAVAAVESGAVDSAVLPAAALEGLTAYDDDGSAAQLEGDSGVFVLGDTEPNGEVISALTVRPDAFALEQPTAAPWMVYVLTIFFGVLFMMSAITYCSQIAQSVVEEKQTRIVEILLATVSPRTIMAGKVLGNSLLALAQVAAVVATASITLAATGQLFFFGLIGPPMLWFAVLFVVGFVLLAALYAGVAATVSRQEDVATATMPLMFVIMVPYMLSFGASGNPVLLTVMSYVPFSAPIAMPVRVFTGDAAWWEPIVALVVLAAAAAAAIWLGSKLYENSILRTGGRVKLREALAS